MTRWRLGTAIWFIVLGLGWVYLPTARSVQAQQNFNAAATVTALVETRTAILAILTQTPPTPPVANTPVNAKDAAPTVTVNVRGLNVRSGPGTNYGVIANINAGKSLTIVGSAANCSWLKVQDSGRDLGWISGSNQFVTFTTPCAALPTAAVPPAPTPAPTATPRPANAAASAEGCYLLINQLGFDLTITLSRSDGWSDSFALGVGAEREYCAPAGDYQYTLQAPGALGAIQGALTIKAGERYRLPLKLGN